MGQKKPRILVFASGNGSLFESIARAARMGNLQGEVVGLIVSKAGTGAESRARELKVPSLVINDSPSSDSMDQEILRLAQTFQPDWIALAGFVKKIGPAVLRAYPNRIVNIHPGPLPQFGGKGMYGRKVHAAVIASGRAETSVTVHLVDEHYDHGRTLAVLPVAIEKGESAESLEARVKAEEIRFYPKVLNDLITGQLAVS